MQTCPRIVIGATASGTGKTSVALGIAAALKQRGLRVQTFKVGPDYLDPTYLAAASGRPCYNLDGWMMGREYVEKLFARTTVDADIAVIEGVMGLFDGAKAGSLEGSTAEIALWLDAPVLLVVNTHGMAQSIAAIVKGFAELESELKVAGVIANRCGSEAHSILLGGSLKSASLPDMVAAIPRGGLPELTSRHLGLVTARPKTLGQPLIDDLANTLMRYADLDDVIAIAKNAPQLAIDAPAKQNRKERVRLGVAFDDAFHFYYQDFFDELEDRGCTIVRFSPLSDSSIPENLDALYFGGGYPEVMARELSSNRAMISSLQTFAASNRPIYAECGGLMYLSQGIESTDGSQYAMTGLLPAMTKMHDKRQVLAYVEVTLKKDSLWGRSGDTARGHEFHYSRLTSDPADREGWESIYSIKKRRGHITDEGYQKGRILASYAHMHLPAREQALEYFINTCKGER